MLKSNTGWYDRDIYYVGGANFSEEITVRHIGNTTNSDSSLRWALSTPLRLSILCIISFLLQFFSDYSKLFSISDRPRHSKRWTFLLLYKDYLLPFLTSIPKSLSKTALLTSLLPFPTSILFSSKIVLEDLLWASHNAKGKTRFFSSNNIKYYHETNTEWFRSIQNTPKTFRWAVSGRCKEVILSQSEKLLSRVRPLLCAPRSLYPSPSHLTHCITVY